MTEELKHKVEHALESIRPYLKADGGDVKILGLEEENTLLLELLGNCSSCPMSAMTLKAGVEEAIIRAVPEIIMVRAVNITSPDDPNAQLPPNMG